MFYTTFSAYRSVSANTNQCSGPERGRMSNEKLKKIDPSKLSAKIDLSDCEHNYTFFWQDPFKQAKDK